MFDTVFGLPVHPLIVHATVVTVPAAAVLVAAAMFSRRFRIWSGPVPLMAALASCVLVPLSTGSGEQLRGQLPPNPLIAEHAELADTLIWFVVPLTVAAGLAYWLRRRPRAAPKVTTVVAVLCVVFSAATLVDVALVGHSGAKAAWSGVVATHAATR